MAANGSETSSEQPVPWSVPCSNLFSFSQPENPGKSSFPDPSRTRVNPFTRDAWQHVTSAYTYIYTVMLERTVKIQYAPYFFMNSATVCRMLTSIQWTVQQYYEFFKSASCPGVHDVYNWQCLSCCLTMLLCFHNTIFLYFLRKVVPPSPYSWVSLNMLVEYFHQRYNWAGWGSSHRNRETQRLHTHCVKNCLRETVYYVQPLWDL